jgi:Fic-DOC domain mobile mystery protein B
MTQKKEIRMDFAYPPGATPLNKDEISGLIPTHITTRAELDRLEQENINDAMLWLRSARSSDILSVTFLKRLHNKMFCNVWRWAGTFRKGDKNIGVAWHQIPVKLKKLCDDVHYWIENISFSEDEMAARFHHRLVSIHLFANGNGRHARLITDLLLVTLLNKPGFTWGGADLIRAGQDRKRHIDALHAADKGDYKLLLEFVRS